MATGANTRQHYRIDLASLQLGQVDLTVAIDGGLVRAIAQIERHVDMAVEDQDAVVQGGSVGSFVFLEFRAVAERSQDLAAQRHRHWADR